MATYATPTVDVNAAEAGQATSLYREDVLLDETTQDVFISGLVTMDADMVFTTATTIAEEDATYDGQDILIDGATVAIDGPHSFNSVELVNGAVLTHSPNTSTETHKLDLNVTEQVSVDATSRIDVSGKGYREERTTGNTDVGGVTGGSGGSYGGLGASHRGSTNADLGLMVRLRGMATPDADDVADELWRVHQSIKSEPNAAPQPDRGACPGSSQPFSQ